MIRILTLVIASLVASPIYAFNLPNLTFPAQDGVVSPSTQGAPATEATARLSR